MKIEHVAIWTRDLEAMKSFYEKYFEAVAGAKYHNPVKEFHSYFLSFREGARLELMYMPTIGVGSVEYERQKTGIIHFAMAVGSQSRVNELTEEIRRDGWRVAGEPRWTGDGYYESVVLDPDGNIVEITI